MNNKLFRHVTRPSKPSIILTMVYTNVATVYKANFIKLVSLEKFLKEKLNFW